MVCQHWAAQSTSPARKSVKCTLIWSRKSKNRSRWRELQPTSVFVRLLKQHKNKPWAVAHNNFKIQGLVDTASPVRPLFETWIDPENIPNNTPINNENPKYRATVVERKREDALPLHCDQLLCCCYSGLHPIHCWLQLRTTLPGPPWTPKWPFLCVKKSKLESPVRINYGYEMTAENEGKSCTGVLANQAINRTHCYRSRLQPLDYRQAPVRVRRQSRVNITNHIFCLCRSRPSIFKTKKCINLKTELKANIFALIVVLW